MSDESYLVVQGRMMARTAKAVLIKVGQRECWIARSCIHFATDALIDHMDRGDAGEFKIMEWAAREKGLI